MFDIGFWELSLIGLIALLVIGPKRLPEAARTAGQWVGRLRIFISNVKQDLDQQLQSEEMEELRRLRNELTETKQVLEKSSSDLVGSLIDAGEKLRSGSLLEAVDQSIAAPVKSSDSVHKKKTTKSSAKRSASKKQNKKRSVKRKSTTTRKKSSRAKAKR